jgi:hypothetical protein
MPGGLCSTRGDTTTRDGCDQGRHARAEHQQRRWLWDRSRACQTHDIANQYVFLVAGFVIVTLCLTTAEAQTALS